MWKYLLAWVPMVIIAIANGLFREKIVAKRFDELQAHQVSTATLILLFGVYIWIINRLWPLESTGQALKVGFIWLALTVAFEFLFGHYVAGHSWQRLFRDYNLLEGRLWLLILVWVTLAPLVFFKIDN